jgi:hypothetical protein
MDQKKCLESIPESVLTSLEDMSSDILDLRELMLTLAAAAPDLADRIPTGSCDSIH